MKFSAALLTIIAATGANAFWEVPEEHQGSNEKLQKYFVTFPGCPKRAAVTQTPAKFKPTAH
ncbi:hypothetical protein MCOR07_002864 [Pyricularia oryzae]|nr:hypothetical protein MCOR23_005059 [Pyricularia oryzae]KAI6589387.1 hypothetical protein MCOR06_005499 [Pyricularia oryzae]KAI6625553.1 hypothetical protein MCOR07_002864 [Pyricularia oryzae]